jgi:hypothetical protein
VRFVRAFLRFWYDFLIGDDWRIAAGVAVAMAAGAVLVRTEALGDTAITALGFAAIVIGLVLSLTFAARSARRGA